MTALENLVGEGTAAFLKNEIGPVTLRLCGFRALMVWFCGCPSGAEQTNGIVRNLELSMTETDVVESQGGYCVH